MMAVIHVEAASLSHLCTPHAPTLANGDQSTISQHKGRTAGGAVFRAAEVRGGIDRLEDF